MGGAEEYSTHPELQHVLPPQHCRCGMQCGISYLTYKMEEHDLGSVLGALGVPLTALPSNGTVVRPYFAPINRAPDMHSFVTKSDVARLDALTALERFALG